MNIIGRFDEQQTILDCVRSGKPEFLVLYGRRRVGKTYLIREYFKNRFAFYASGIPGENTREQLRVWNDSLKRYGSKEKRIPDDWLEAFSRLRDLLESNNVSREPDSDRIVVFLDELPWMDTPRSGFKNALDYFWNTWGSARSDLLLIVCGSATSWIIDNIITNTGGLYNRITRQIRLKPFSLSECEKQFVADGHIVSRNQVIESYLVFGGIPYYINMCVKSLSVSQNVDRLLFSDNAQLGMEYENLFRSLFRNPDGYLTLIERMAGRRAGFTRNELLEMKDTPSGGKLTRILTELEQCGFIRKYRDYRYEKKECVYQVTDPFVLFCVNFLKKREYESWTGFIGTPGYYAWRGYAFEIAGLNHIREIKSALGISGVETKEYAWRSKTGDGGAEIDLVLDRRDDVINVCEMKYSDEPFVISADYEKKLIHKMEMFRTETRTAKALRLTLITVNGLAKNTHSQIVQNVITADELFGGGGL